MIIEYTWNELEKENLSFMISGKKLTSLAGPEKADVGDLYWSPAFDEAGKPFDLYWKHSGCFGDADFFTLAHFTPSDIEYETAGGAA
jgi:hypothetical protein